MVIISNPMQYALTKLHERRSSPSPAMDMTGDMGVFMVRKALFLYGPHYARFANCINFVSPFFSFAAVRKRKTPPLTTTNGMLTRGKRTKQ